MMMVSVLSPSCVVPSEANSPTCRICQWLAADMQPVKTGKQEEEGTEGVEEGDAGVEEVAGQHGGQVKEAWVATLVYSSKGLIVMCLRSWWSRGLILCWSSLLLSSWDGLKTQGSQEGNPGGGLLWVH